MDRSVSFRRLCGALTGAVMILSAATVLAEDRPADTPAIAQARATWTALLAEGQGWGARAAEVEYGLAMALTAEGRNADAEKHWRRLAVQVRRFNGKNSKEDLAIRSRWADALGILERWEEAERVAAPAYPAALATWGPNDENTDRLRLSLASVMVWSGRYDRAAELLQPSFDYQMGQGRIGDAQVIGDTLSIAYSRLGRIDDQTAVLNRMAGASGLGAERRMLDLTARFDLAMARDDLPAAETVARTLLAARTQGAPTDREAVRDAEGKLALVLSLPVTQSPTSPRMMEAEALYRRLYVEGTPEERPRIAGELGSLLMNTSDEDSARVDEALALTRERLDDERRRLGPLHPAVVNSEILVGMFLMQRQRIPEARAMFDQIAAAENAGAPLSARQRGLLALMRARLDFETGDRMAAYRGIAASAAAFRDFALQTGSTLDRRRELDSWAFLYRGQVGMAWTLASGRETRGN